MRFLAVVAVIFYHAYHSEPGQFIVAPPHPGTAQQFAEGFVSQSLARFGLPLLAVISGYLFFRTFAPTVAGYLEKLRTRVRTLLVPFLIWSGLGVLFALALTHTPAGSISPYWTITSFGEAIERWLVHPVLYPLWYLQALMVCVVIAPLFYWLIRLLRGWTLVVVAVWWCTGFAPLSLQPWLSATVTPMFIAGATVALRGWKLPAGLRRPAAVWGLLAAWLAAAALYAESGARWPALERTFLLVVVVLAMVALWTVYDALTARLRPAERAPRLARFALTVASLSFFVYAAQEPTLSVLKHVGERLSGGGGAGAGAQPAGIVVYLAAPLATIVIGVVLALVVARLLPRVYRVITGGRGPAEQARLEERVARAPR